MIKVEAREQELESALASKAIACTLRVFLLLAFSYSLSLVCEVSEGRAQIASQAYATKYFLDQPPSAAEVSRLPTNAKDATVAKVHIVGSIFSRGGRDQSGLPPTPPKKYVFGAELRIVDVLSGNAAKGARYDVSFGPSGARQRYKYPHTPRMRARDYFVIFYLDANGVRRLVGTPATKSEYNEWNSEVRDYERGRGRPGVHQD